MSSLNSCRPFKLVNCTWQMCEAWLIICETICAPFSGDWEGGAEGSDAQGWRQQWICVRGGSSIKHRKTHAFHSCSLFQIISVPLPLMILPPSSTWFYTPSPPHPSSFPLPPPGQLVRWFCLICCQDSAGGDGAAVPGLDHHWNTLSLTDNNNLRIHCPSVIVFLSSW